MKREIIDASKLELEDKVVAIKRVTKVVKGGRNSRVAALVVVGDRNGHVGELLVAAIFALIIISQCVNMPMCQLAALYATWPLTN